MVLITLDTLRADRVGSYGGPVATPHLDRLAAEGSRFANAATTVPFTLPAHSSLLTGTYPPTHGVRENVGYYLDEKLPTVAELLRDAGYATAGFVSSFVLDARWGIARGFDTYYDEFDLAEVQTANLGDVQRDGKETVAQATAWLRQHGGSERPFFVWVHLFDPHDPYTPPEPYRSRYPGRPYDGEVAYTDSLVGELIGVLEELALLEHTLLIATADHGEGLGDHGEHYHGFFVYDTTVHVPLLVRPPFQDLARGEVFDEAVSHVDLAPTILDAAGVDAPAHLQGRSLLPQICGEPAGDAAAERVVYSESLYPLLHYGWAPLRAARGGRHKLIAAPRVELYDLHADPGERANLADQLTGARALLEGRLAELRERIESAPSASVKREVDAAALAQLRALGYVAPAGEVDPSAEDDRPRADPKDRLRLHQLLMGAQSAFGSGDHAVAERNLRAALAQDPGIVDAHQLLGQLYLDQGRGEAAIASFQGALAISPEHRASLFGLANAYSKDGRTQEAIVGFERLLDLGGYDSKAAMALARLRVEQGDRAGAVEVLERATEPQDAPAALLNDLGELLAELGQLDAALAAFERARRNSEQLALPRFNLAVAHEEMAQTDTAVAMYEECLRLAPRNHRCLFNLGRLAGAAGDRERQRSLWEAALEANPDFVRGYFLLAKLLMDQGVELPRAEELTRIGIERDPEHRNGPLGHFLLADILNRRGRPEEAQRALAEARRVEAESRQ
ncbi:MAG TPA: sulfatase-like hydrolase/transferase [Thermoanaerobaculia bacterium]|nr:sulfatase-like hydrolase/transferase [Thermoanaerobaculia bacterium]